MLFVNGFFWPIGMKNSDAKCFGKFQSFLIILDNQRATQIDIQKNEGHEMKTEEKTEEK